ncbi:MAG: hypothetical protein MZW92_46265 [Comamonadaceae bacterium]|nr:hypothetical protein [Comamonadaceae bacterium]
MSLIRSSPGWSAWRLPRALSVALLFVLLAGALILLGLWLVPYIVQRLAAFAAVARLPGGGTRACPAVAAVAVRRFGGG